MHELLLLQNKNANVFYEFQLGSPEFRKQRRDQVIIS